MALKDTKIDFYTQKLLNATDIQSIVFSEAINLLNSDVNPDKVDNWVNKTLSTFSDKPKPPSTREIMIAKDKEAFIELKKFLINSITVQTNYRFGSSDRTFNYKSELPIGIYQYFYNVYSKVRNEENEKQRKNTELSMESIRNVIGKSGSRDRKLDILLGD